MRIDNRKVNGRIVFEPGDIIRTWTILIDSVGPDTWAGTWISGFDEDGEPVTVPNDVVVTGICATKFPLSFTVLNGDGEQKILPFPVYSFNNDGTKIFIDIDEIMTGKTLEIALPSGAITVK